MERLHASVVRYAIPLVFGDRPHPVKASRFNSGSGVAIDAGEGPFLITAAHVVEAARNRLAEPRTHFMVGPVEVSVEDIISERHQIDVATIRLRDKDLALLEKDNFQIVRPSEWPPVSPSVGDSVVLAGFPAQWRSELSWIEIDHAAEVMRSFVRAVMQDQFVTHLEPEFAVQRMVDVALEPKSAGFEGLSGGPAFLVRDLPGKLTVPALCGVVKEGGISDLVPGRFVIYYSILDRIGRDGVIT